MKGLFAFFSMAVLVWAMLITPASLLANNTDPVKDVVTYYNIDEQPLNQLSSWNSAPDGSGDAPISFDTDNTVWQIIHDATLSDQWTITGENAKVLVGNQTDEVSFIIMGDGNLDAVVDITSEGFLVLIGKNYPDFGEFASGSTVVFSFGLHTIPYHDYYNLTFAGITPAFHGNGTIRIRGVMELTGTVVFPDARGGNEYSFEFYGPDIQFITTGGNVLRSYNFSAEKTQGSLRLAENSVVSADNQVRLNFTDNATFRDSGNTIYAGNSVNIDGSPNAYDFTGTLILAGTEPGIVNGAGAGNNFNLRNNNNEDGPAVAPLHNIVVRAANTGGQFRFRGAEGNVFSIKGDLIIESQADGRIRFYNNQVRIEGDFIIEEGFAGTIDAFQRLGFVGGEPQQVHPGIRIQTAILDVDNAIHVDGGILYTSQLVNLENWVSTAPEGIFAISTSTTINDDPEETPYFLGNLGYYIASSEPQQLFFRVGNQTDLLPLLVSLTQEDDSEVLYYTRVADHPLPDLEIPSDIEVILEDYFYFFDWDENANIESLSVSIPFELPDNDLDTDLLRMVKSSGSQWINLGGSFTGFHVEASIPTNEGGFLALGQQLISSSKSITSFVLEELAPAVIGVINEVDKTITLEVPFGTDVEALIPTITHTGVSILPESGEAQDFSQPVEYTVMAEDETTAIYVATVTVLPSQEPFALQITDIHDDEEIFTETPFSLTARLLNAANDVVNAVEDITVTVSLASGAGTLSGILEGIIEQGTSETIINGILYDTPDTGVSLMVSAEGLEPDVSEEFTVSGRDFTLTLLPQPENHGHVEGGGTITEGESVSIKAYAYWGADFLGWFVNDELESAEQEYTFTMPAQDVTLTAVFDDDDTKNLTLFWFFGGNLPNNAPLESIDPHFTLEGFDATLEFHSALAGYPFDADHPNWRKASMERRNAPTPINYSPLANNDLLFGESGMRGLQVKQPFAGDGGENMIIFHIPTTEMSEWFHFSFAAKDEGAAHSLLIDYSLDENEIWINTGLTDATLGLLEDFQRYSLDFSSIEGVFDNPYFRIRIRFDGDDMTADEGNRVTFNNFALDTYPEATEQFPPVADNAPGLQKVIANGAPIILDLDDIFSHPLSLSMTYSAESNRPEMVKASLSGNILTLEGLASGDALITLAASDGILDPVEAQFRVLVYPEAVNMVQAGSYSFSFWSADAPEHTYPDHIIFLQSEVMDPGIDEPLLWPYFIPHDQYHEDDQENIGFPYRNTRRTRINGLGHQGISFINTGRSTDLGGALLALNTSDVGIGDDLTISWLAGTIVANSRIYAIRLQYRTGIDGEFSDILHDGEPLEYRVNSDGHTSEMDMIPLPASLLNQEYVQLLWRYYFVEGDSGSRPELRLDNISVTFPANTEHLAQREATVFSYEGCLTIDYPFASRGKVSVFNTLGQEVFSADLSHPGTHRLYPSLEKGIYIVRIQGDDAIVARKIYLK